MITWKELSEEALAHKRAQASQWLHEHRSQIRKSYGLHLPHTVTSVHVGSGRQPLVTDGPLLEGTEVIGGIAEIEVANLDEALHLAKGWSVHAPGYNVVEIWPVVEEQHLHV
ncbi:YciI family protein [Ktedonobacter sp. SOSP1-52]|uniref:YciI family protein n=1 Tax=Ktedonobacter sp. SOSP1-52 TaxID=2778366 RepID=UPI001F2A1943|nr:YciI family protein [Ktedonobacter sp. SOSP1-52]